MSDFLERISKLDPKRLALLAAGLQSRLEALEREKREPLAIIGMACRFPGGADSPRAFWELLAAGVDAITEAPASKWDNAAYYDPEPSTPGKISTRWGGYIDGLDQFDPQFFGISPREAASMDPQQRLLLEVAWEALENSGHPAKEIMGSQTGVFIGISGVDFHHLMLDSGEEQIDAYLASGSAHSIASGRLSYFLGAQGPSISVDTACSSSLTAIHLAIQSLRSGECDLAIAGGVNAILTPGTSITLSKANMLSPDGRCKTFDSRADGFTRGEGCGLIVLKRLSQALADKDRILAVVRGSAINQDGRSNGLTAPNGPSQEAVIRRALENAGVEPGQMSYVETHGTGTALGDPIEVQALGSVLCQDRSGPLYIGSVKTNIGHLESAAGVAGVIKTVLALQHKLIPPHLHLQERNPYIPWEDYPAIEIPTAPTPWEPVSGKRIAGVSSFGFSGTNIHLVLEEAPEQPRGEPAVERPRHIFTLSARSQPALDDLVRRYREHLAGSQEPLADICFTTNAGRSHFSHRLATVIDSTPALVEKLAAFAAGPEAEGVLYGQAPAGRAGRIALLFTGQGAQYAGMGRELYDTQPTFRQALDRCAELLAPHLERPLLEVIFGSGSAIDDTNYTQPALFALEYALAELWKSWGVRPSAVMGHSVGEYAAAVAAGVFSLEDGLKLIAARGKLMGSLPAGGKMAAVFAPEDTVRSALRQAGDQVSVAAVNGPDHTVISGPGPDVEALVAQFNREGVQSRFLTVSHAFHSHLMDPILGAFTEVARGVTYSEPEIDLLSNVTGAPAVPGQLTDPAYWVGHIRQPVRFADSIVALYQQGYRHFVEIGPHPVLLGMARRCIEQDEAAWMPSLRKGKPDWQQLLESLGGLYVRGVEVDWEGFDRDYREQGGRRRIELPTYPFQRERYWTPQPVRKQTGPAGTRPADPRLSELLYQVEWVDQAGLGGPGFAAEVNLQPAQIALQLGELVEQLAVEYGIAPYTEMLPQLDILCRAFIVQALRQLGMDFEAGADYTLAELEQRLGIIPAHRSLLQRMLQILGEDGILERAGEAWRVRRAPEVIDPQAMWADLLARYPTLDAELNLTGRVASSLAQALNGSIPALQLLFPNGSTAETEKLYQDSPSARFYNNLMRQAVQAAVAQLPPDEPLRVIEIGAGTGGTTTHVLPALPADRTEYTFTDISPLFTARAQEKFAAYPFVDCRTLDITRDLQAQGIVEGSYQIVIAANVLHATPDLRQTLRNVRKLLAPGGLLLLIEATEKQRFGDLTVGLTEGWWAYQDRDLRPDYALLTKRGWQTLLAEMGFESTAIVPGEEGQDAFALFAQQALIMTCAPHQADHSPFESSGAWIVLADRQGAGEALSQRLAELGEQVITVEAGDAYQCLLPQRCTIRPDEPDDFRKLLATAPLAGAPLRGVVHLWSLDLPAAEDLSPASLEAGQALAAGSLLHLAQALAGLGGTEPPRLFVATQGAQPAGFSLDAGGEPPLAFSQAPVWGLCRVIALEHPELRCTRLDLDPGAAAPEQAPALLREILHPQPGEDQIAIRGKRRKVPRFSRVRDGSETTLPAEFPIRAEASYLITGGLGGLGLAVAGWMVERGARNLILIGRREPSEAARKTIEGLEARGARVLVCRSDVTQSESLAACLAQASASLPPLRGIIHAAGVLDDGVLAHQNWERFRKVMAPKVTGTWNLHHLTRDQELDFCILFSSGASVLGSAGQGNHAAANAFLDAFAYYQTAVGCPTVSINWGAWAEIGAAAGLKAAAIRKMTPQEGLQAFAWAFHSRPGSRLPLHVQYTVIDVDWEAYFRALPSGHAPAFTLDFARLPGAPQAQAVAGPDKPAEAPNFLDEVSALLPKRRFNHIAAEVRRQAARVLGIDPQKTIDLDLPLSEMGLDSLMAVELRNKLSGLAGQTLPSTLLFEYPTIRGLAAYLEQTLFPAAEVEDQEAQPPDGQAPQDGAAETPDLDDMSEEEIAALLAEKISSINRSIG